MGDTIGKNNNTRTVQAESSKFASVLFDQGFQIWVGWNWLERHLSVFCIDPIVPGFVVYYVNWLYFLNIFDLFFKILDQCVCQLVVLVTLDQIWIQMIFRYLTVHTILPPHHTTIDTQPCTSFLLIASKVLSMAGWRLLWTGLRSFQSE